MKVSPSILAGNLAAIGDTVASLDSRDIDLIHLDIMDGHFVPALTFGEAIVKQIPNYSSIPLDIHLMVSNPHREVAKYFHLKPYNITFHFESTSFPIRLAQSIREKGIRAGISFNPSTNLEVLKDLYPFFDIVLLMTVEPGYYGQAFLPNSFERISRVVQMRNDLRKIYDNDLEIEVDGGVSDKNIHRLTELGVDIVVAGSYLFKSIDPNKQARSLKLLQNI